MRFWRRTALPNPSGRGVLLRSLVDLKLASLLVSLYRLLPTARGAVLDVGCGNQPYPFSSET